MPSDHVLPAPDTPGAGPAPAAREHEPMTAPAVSPPRPGDLLELVAGEAAHGGWCVARTGGQVVFVRHALPGERVRARVTQATTRFARADAVEILDPSPDRVPPPCPHARPGGCGGCDWQHASLPAQRALKAAVIRQQLRRIAGIDRDVVVEPVDGDHDGLGWRTRVRFAVRKDGTAGLRQHRSHAIVPVQVCPIGNDLVNGSGVARERWPGARSVEVATAPGPGQAGQTAVLADGAMVRGPQFLEQHAAGRSWRTGAATFWQVHPGAAGTLAAAVLDALRPAPGATVLDLYCGAGLFAGVLASAVGPDGTVIGIEADTGAVRDARHNLRPTPWARVHKGDAAAMLGRYGVSGATLAVLDPPRAGADRAVTEILAASGPGGGGPLQRIAYVSCDPATLARDLAVFGEQGWDLETLRAFDVFPMTHHVECLAVLSPW
jgi:tRNA/tmRNA/rRNA uracil-C5-methylase (TrmA/RlmC/RlmD family)